MAGGKVEAMVDLTWRSDSLGFVASGNLGKRAPSPDGPGAEGEASGGGGRQTFPTRPHVSTPRTEGGKKGGIWSENRGRSYSKSVGRFE